MNTTGMMLVLEGPNSYVIQGGPCHGTALRVLTSPEPHVDPPKGWRGIQHDHQVLRDLESGEWLVVIADSPPPLSHHDGFDGRGALETYFAIEAVVSVIERWNRPPVLSWHDLNTVRTVRPAFPEPPARVQLMPWGEWTPDFDTVWQVGPALLNERGAAANVKVELLKRALRTLDHGHEALSWFVVAARELDRFDWFRGITKATRIGIGGAARKKARAPGVHVVKNLMIEVVSEAVKDRPREVRKVPAPMWLHGHETLILAEGVEPTVDDVKTLLKEYSSMGPAERLRAATQLLSMSGVREQHEELERRFEAELTGRIGSELEVTVSIRPKEEALTQQG